MPEEQKLDEHIFHLIPVGEEELFLYLLRLWAWDT